MIDIVVSDPKDDEDAVRWLVRGGVGADARACGRRARSCTPRSSSPPTPICPSTRPQPSRSAAATRTLSVCLGEGRCLCPPTLTGGLSSADLRAHLVTQVNNNEKTKGSLRRVPELPGKKLWGKFEPQFIEGTACLEAKSLFVALTRVPERRKGLEEFLNRVAGHAICRLEPGFHHFLEDQGAQTTRERGRFFPHAKRFFLFVSIDFNAATLPA